MVFHNLSLAALLVIDEMRKNPHYIRTVDMLGGGPEGWFGINYLNWELRNDPQVRIRKSKSLQPTTLHLRSASNRIIVCKSLLKRRTQWPRSRGVASPARELTFSLPRTRELIRQG